jgi:NYN domain
MEKSASSAGSGVLLMDWENLAGSLLGRGKVIDRSYVDALWAFANHRCGNELHRSHLAAAKIDGSIQAAMREHRIEAEQVRSTKEQADIVLTILAMDYLHAGVGNFFLVTGDQDFIPLISRIHQDGRHVTVIYGDPNRLSANLRRALDTSGVESLDIAELTQLRERGVDTGLRSLLGLLELQRRGFILGGPEKGDRTNLLWRWGVLENQDEDQYWSLINDMTERIVRTDAAVKDKNEWVPRNARRTYLRLTADRIADIMAIDFATRLISSRTNGLTLAGLRTGPFQTDNGTKLDRVLDALSAVEVIRKGADDVFSATDRGMQLGYLEQIWRVFAGLSAECYQLGKATIPFRRLEPLLNRRGVGLGKDYRAQGKIKDAISYAQAAGVIDTVSVDRERHAKPINSSLSRQLELAYHELYRGFSERVGAELPAAEVMDFMEQHDNDRNLPVFGFGDRDRRRIVRILSQSQLLRSRNEKITVLRSRWGDAGLAMVN